MKRLFSAFCAIVAVVILEVSAAAETVAAPAALTFSEKAAAAGRLLGLFLLAMAAIYIILLSTKKIAEWIDKHKT